MVMGERVVWGPVFFLVVKVHDQFGYPVLFGERLGSPGDDEFPTK